MCNTLGLEKMPIATERKVVVAFLECLVGGLRYERKDTITTWAPDSLNLNFS